MPTPAPTPAIVAPDTRRRAASVDAHANVPDVEPDVHPEQSLESRRAGDIAQTRRLATPSPRSAPMTSPQPPICSGELREQRAIESGARRASRRARSRQRWTALPRTRSRSEVLLLGAQEACLPTRARMLAAHARRARKASRTPRRWAISACITGVSAAGAALARFGARRRQRGKRRIPEHDANRGAARVRECRRAPTARRRFACAPRARTRRRPESEGRPARPAVACSSARDDDDRLVVPREPRRLALKQLGHRGGDSCGVGDMPLGMTSIVRSRPADRLRRRLGPLDVPIQDVGDSWLGVNPQRRGDRRRASRCR